MPCVSASGTPSAADPTPASAAPQHRLARPLPAREVDDRAWGTDRARCRPPPALRKARRDGHGEGLAVDDEIAWLAGEGDPDRAHHRAGQVPTPVEPVHDGRFTGADVPPREPGRAVCG